MPHEQRRIEIVRTWLVKSHEDLVMAERALQPTEITGDAVFHCQQAVEKALKGYLTWMEREFPRTHDLRLLVEMCEEVDATLGELRTTAQMLTPFASAPRYPEYGAPPTVADAWELIRVANSAVELVLARLPDSVRP